jgi:hypothetical protein
MDIKTLTNAELFYAAAIHPLKNITLMQDVFSDFVGYKRKMLGELPYYWIDSGDSEGSRRMLSFLSLLSSPVKRIPFVKDGDILGFLRRMEVTACIQEEPWHQALHTPCNCTSKPFNVAKLATHKLEQKVRGFLSHLRAIRHAYKDGHEHAVILEDRVSFEVLPTWISPLKDQITSLPKGWDQFVLSSIMTRSVFRRNLEKWRHLNRPAYMPSSVISQGGNFFQSGAYVLSRVGMKKVLRRFPEDGPFESCSHNVFTHGAWDIEHCVLGDLKRVFEDQSGDMVQCSPEDGDSKQHRKLKRKSSWKKKKMRLKGRRGKRKKIKKRKVKGGRSHGYGSDVTPSMTQWAKYLATPMMMSEMYAGMTIFFSQLNGLTKDNHTVSIVQGDLLSSRSKMVSKSVVQSAVWSFVAFKFRNQSIYSSPGQEKKHLRNLADLAQNLQPSIFHQELKRIWQFSYPNKSQTNH